MIRIANVTSVNPGPVDEISAALAALSMVLSGHFFMDLEAM
jgi:hypothetical protein